jgi:hypothetical protein
MPYTRKVSSEVLNRRTDITMAKRKRTKGHNNDLQNITQKTKDRATRTPIKTIEGDLRCSGRVGSSCTTCGTRQSIHLFF